MTAYMGHMPWVMLWLSIPWIGSLMTLLGNPNGMYSRRVLGWSVGCFLLLSMGLWFANPELFMTDMVVGVSKYDTTRGTIFTGMMFSAIMFLFTWPDGKTAKGLTLLGSALLLMVGVRFGLPKYIYTELMGVLNPMLFGFGMVFIMVSAPVLWVLSIPYLTKKNTLAFDQAPLFGKLMYFLRWSLLFFPFILLKTSFIDYSPNSNGYVRTSQFLSLTLLYTEIALPLITLQSWRIPGFWRNVGMYFLSPIMYFFNARYTYRMPLTSDKTALSQTASPEHIAFWNPWAIMNRGMIQLFFGITRPWLLLITVSSYNPLPPTLGTELDMALYAKIGLSLIMALHGYALFQPRFVPYRFLLWCSMIGLLLLSFFSDLFYAALSLESFDRPLSAALSAKSMEGQDVLDPWVDEFAFLIIFTVFSIVYTAILLPMIRSYKYRALLNTDETNISCNAPLSRFWVLSLLGTSLASGLYSLYFLTTLK